MALMALITLDRPGLSDLANYFSNEMPQSSSTIANEASLPGVLKR